VATRIDIKSIVAVSLSDVGPTRPENQDRCGDVRDSSARLLVIADGMGGHRGGATASAACVAAFEDSFKGAAASSEERLLAAFERANDEIFTRSCSDQNVAGMGTTGVALLLASDGEACVGWVGDSRAYLWRDGSLRQLTFDHSLVEEWVRIGVLSAEEAENHPRRAELTRAIGISDEVLPDFRSLPILAGDRFMLCSDGLCGIVPAEQIAAVLGSEPPERAIRALLELAVKGGTRDNITVQIAEIGAPEPATRSESRRRPARSTLIAASVTALAMATTLAFALALAAFM